MYVCIVGVMVNYIIGISYMYIAMNSWLELEIGYVAAWTSMVPFLIKDIGLALMAALVFKRYAHRFTVVSSRLKMKF